MASTAISKQQNLLALLNKSQSQLALALPKHMTADRMIRVAITAIRKQPKLFECDPLSVCGAVMEASQLGLYPDGILGDAYLVPYYNKRNRRLEAQLQPGYRGLINLARRSGQISNIYAEPVYECDEFHIELGTKHTINHVPNYDDDSRGVEKDEKGIPVGMRGVYAVVVFKDGTADFEYMPIKRILDIRDHSQAADNGPWVTHFEEMARKTPIRRLAKRLPLSPEFQRAAILDEYVDAGVAPSAVSEIENSEFARAATEQKENALVEKYGKKIVEGKADPSQAPEVSKHQPPSPPEPQPNDESFSDGELPEEYGMPMEFEQ